MAQSCDLKMPGVCEAASRRKWRTAKQSWRLMPGDTRCRSCAAELEGQAQQIVDNVRAQRDADQAPPSATTAPPPSTAAGGATAAAAADAASSADLGARPKKRARTGPAAAADKPKAKQLKAAQQTVRRRDQKISVQSGHLADLHEQLAAMEAKVAELGEEVKAHGHKVFAEAQVRAMQAAWVRSVS